MQTNKGKSQVSTLRSSLVSLFVNTFQQQTNQSNHDKVCLPYFGGYPFLVFFFASLPSGLGRWHRGGTEGGVRESLPASEVVAPLDWSLGM